jgi:hypothetical protein
MRNCWHHILACRIKVHVKILRDWQYSAQSACNARIKVHVKTVALCLRVANDDECHCLQLQKHRLTASCYMYSCEQINRTRGRLMDHGSAWISVWVLSFPFLDRSSDKISQALLDKDKQTSCLVKCLYRDVMGHGARGRSSRRWPRGA